MSVNLPLEAVGLNTPESLALMSVAALVQRTGMGVQEAVELLGKVRASLAAKPTPLSAVPKPRTILGIPAMAPGAITELYGISGAGKTQLAFSIAATGGFTSVFWLDTEGTYRSERVVQMATSPDCLENLRVRQVRDEVQLVQSIEMIKQMLRSVRPQAVAEMLILVDSITADIKVTEKIKKAETLSKVAQLLKSVGCCVLVTNQVRAEIKTHAFESGPDFHAALGSTWGSSVNVRLQVHREGKSRTLKVVSSPDPRSKDLVVHFTVSTDSVDALTSL
jgi:hypothetical protein